MPQASVHDKPSTFASRAAERETRLAAGEVEPERRAFSIRANVESETANVVMTRVRQ